MDENRLDEEEESLDAAVASPQTALAQRAAEAEGRADALWDNIHALEKQLKSKRGEKQRREIGERISALTGEQNIYYMEWAKLSAKANMETFSAAEAEPLDALNAQALRARIDAERALLAALEKEPNAADWAKYALPFHDLADDFAHSAARACLLNALTRQCGGEAIYAEHVAPLLEEEIFSACARELLKYPNTRAAEAVLIETACRSIGAETARLLHDADEITHERRNLLREMIFGARKPSGTIAAALDGLTTLRAALPRAAEEFRAAEKARAAKECAEKKARLRAQQIIDAKKRIPISAAQKQLLDAVGRPLVEKLCTAAHRSSHDLDDPVSLDVSLWPLEAAAQKLMAAGLVEIRRAGDEPDAARCHALTQRGADVICAYEQEYNFDRTAWHTEFSLHNVKPYTPARMRTPTDNRDNLVSLMLETGWYTDGSLLVKLGEEECAKICGYVRAAYPAIAETYGDDGRGPNLIDLVCAPVRKDGYVRAHPVAVRSLALISWQSENAPVCYLLVADNDPSIRCIVNAKKFETVRVRYPEVEARIVGADKPVGFFSAQNECVGVVMPIVSGAVRDTVINVEKARAFAAAEEEEAL